MRPRDIFDLLNILQVRRIVAGPKWTNASCPLASVMHDEGSDKKPSFGIRYNNNGESLYYCFACSRDPAPLGKLIHDLWLWNMPLWREAMTFYVDNEVFEDRATPQSSSFEELTFPEVSEPKAMVPIYVLNKFPLLIPESGYEARRCKDYLDSRGIKHEVAHAFGIRYAKNEQAIVFPRRIKPKDMPYNTGPLPVWTMRARSRKFKSFFTISPTYMFDSFEWGDNTLWFGEEYLGYSSLTGCTDAVVLVESETDALRLYSLLHDSPRSYVPGDILACSGRLQTAQLNRLYQDTVLLGFDSDSTGELNYIKAKNFLRGRVANLYKLDWSLAGRKDGGEVESMEELRYILDSKRRVEFPPITDTRRLRI